MVSEEEKDRIFDIAMDAVCSNKNDEFRCHEIARYIRGFLADEGYQVRVRDGMVLYDVPHLIKYYLSLCNVSAPIGWTFYVIGAKHKKA